MPRSKIITALDIGTDSIKIGMTKEQVKSIIGDPDTAAPKGSTKDVLRSNMEEWTYKGRYTDMPFKADYFGKNLILTCDGDNLVSYKSTE